MKDTPSNRKFLRSLFSSLQDTSNAEIIHWKEDGFHFKISDMEKFMNEVYPKHFDVKGTPPSRDSFQRQLNKYGFHFNHAKQERFHEMFHKNLSFNELQQIPPKIQSDRVRKFLIEGGGYQVLYRLKNFGYNEDQLLKEHAKVKAVFADPMKYHNEKIQFLNEARSRIQDPKIVVNLENNDRVVRGLPIAQIYTGFDIDPKCISYRFKGETSTFDCSKCSNENAGCSSTKFDLFNASYGTSNDVNQHTIDNTELVNRRKINHPNFLHSREFEKDPRKDILDGFNETIDELLGTDWGHLLNFEDRPVIHHQPSPGRLDDFLHAPLTQVMENIREDTDLLHGRKRVVDHEDENNEFQSKKRKVNSSCQTMLVYSEERGGYIKGILKDSLEKIIYVSPRTFNQR